MNIQNRKSKTMKTITKTIFGVLLTGLSLCTAIAQQVRAVGDFNGIKAGDTFNVNISQGDANTVKVDAPDNLQSQVKTEVKNGILVISGDGTIKSDKPIVISVSVKSISSIEVSGSADVKTENQLTCDNLSVESNGAGNVHLDLKASAIKVIISGAGDVVLKGNASFFDANVSGAGDLKASNLQANKVKAVVTGAGSAKVNAVESIDANVSGAGSIIYKGHPADRNVSISGVGSVRESLSGNGDETASDTTKFKLGRKNYLIYGDNSDSQKSKIQDSIHSYKHDFKHWNGFEIGVNGLMSYNNSLDMPADGKFLELNYAKSVKFGINVFEKDFHIYKNYLNIVTGFGFDFYHYSFQNGPTLNGDTTYLSATTSDIHYKKNSLNISYIKIPLMLEVNTNKNSDKNLHIAAGVQFAYRIHAVAKQKYELDGVQYKTKNRDDFNLEPFASTAVVRIGYNDVTLFAEYSLNRLFKKDQGPQVYPFAIGLTFTL